MSKTKQFFEPFAFNNQYGEQWTKHMEQSMSACREASDALMVSSNVFAKGFETLIKTCASRAQNANEKNAEAWQSFFACRTVNDFAEAQNKLAQDSFEEAIEAASQVSELSAKLLADAWEPLNKQMNSALKKVNEAMPA